jgi:hypothetical protein
VLVHPVAVSIAAIACGAAAQQCNVLPVNKLPMSVLPDRPSLVISTVLRESCGGVGSAFGASASTAEIKLNVRKWPKGEIGSSVRLQRLMFAMASCSKLVPGATNWLT